MRIGADTRVFAILGDPVGHSLSPRMHNAAFQAAGIDAVYVAMQPDAAAVAATMSTLVRRGGGGNVTIPFKQIAAGAAASRDARVQTLGAANVFGRSADGMHVGNTDVDGIVAAVAEIAPTSTAWCVVGTGGSARAVVGAASECSAAIAVRSRDGARARAFVAWAASIGVAEATPEACTVVINATPLGLSATDPLPFVPDTLDAGMAVVDLVYAASEPTRLVQACRARGLPAVDGREVLLVQAAQSWRLWFPDCEPSIEVMRAALNGRLG